MLRKRRNKRIALLVAVLLVILSALCFRFFAGEEKHNENWQDRISYSGLFAVENRNNVSGLKVDFINVGQGDSALIISDGKSMLVDTGNREYYTILKNHIESYGITRLDYVIATHSHADHIGSMDMIIRDYEIGTFIMTEPDENSVTDTEAYKRMTDALEEKGINVKYVKNGDSFSLGDSEIDILGPCRKSENLNDMSIVFMLRYGKNSFLFAADTEKDGEEAILSTGAEIKCNLLKVAHNGSDTSTSEEFLKAADPDIAVISVGADNSYGHPKNEIIERLLKNDITVYRTDYDGTVSFSVPSAESEIIGE